MNLRHGHLWQRLGLTIVSGIVATSYAPAALAAPVDEQGAQSDSSIADLQVSRSEEEAQSGSAAVDQTSARDADTAEAATASSEEKAEEGGSAQVLTFPGTSGPTRIHILSTAGAADAILLESRGVFAMIDGGEGIGAPNGSDPRYPKRLGITPAEQGDTDWVLGYMADHGVTSSNLAFYLGTHAHSDHIDNADDIIKKFHPKVILSPEYSDKWITNPNGLWDNQWIYDNMINAAKWAHNTYGAQLIQHADGYNTHVQLGDMDVQIIPFDPEDVAAEAMGRADEELGEAIIETIIRLMNSPAGIAHRALIRSMLAPKRELGALRDYLVEFVLTTVAKRIGGDEKQARLRAGIIGSQVGGLIMARYIVGIEVIAALSDDEVIAIYGPILQRLIEMPLETGTAQ